MQTWYRTDALNGNALTDFGKMLEPPAWSQLVTLIISVGNL